MVTQISPPPPQALAGSGIFDSVRDGTARHAEAARGGLALPAQLPPRDRVLLRRPGARSSAAQGQLPQEPHQRGGAWPGPGVGRVTAELLKFVSDVTPKQCPKMYAPPNRQTCEWSWSEWL